MNPSRYTTIAAFVIGVTAGFQVPALDITAAIDIGTYAWTDSTTDSPVKFNGNGTIDNPNTVTLSKDTTLTNYRFEIYKPTLFDFSSGNHTLEGISGLWITGGSNVKLLKLKGGKWRFTNGAYLRYAYFDQTYAGGQKFVFDGVDLEIPGASYVNGLFGDNNQILFDNGASLVCSTVSHFFNVDAAVKYTNDLVRVSGGSKFRATSNITMDRGTATSDKPSGNRIEVTGEGSYFGISGTLGDQVFKIGAFPGESVLFEDHAYGRFAHTTIGSGAYGRGNVLTVKGGAGYYSGMSVKLGDSAGADGNRLQIMDRGCFTNNASHVYAGYEGAFNEVVISNACYVGQPIVAGWHDDASNNTVRIEGEDTRVSYTGGTWHFFGKGRHNTFLLKDCNLDLSNHNFYMGNSYDNNVENRTGSTNNTLAVDRNATFLVARFYVPENCCGNTVFVGGGATFKTTQDFRIGGGGNSLVVSNGTVAAGNYYALVVSNAAEEVCNSIVLKGEAPILKTSSSSAEVLLYGNSRIHFDVPACGYSAPPLQVPWIRMRSGGSIVISGVETLARSLKARTATYQLTSGGIFIYDALGNENPQPFLNEINATLPEGSRVYLSNAWDRKLMLSVTRYPRNFSVTFR